MNNRSVIALILVASFAVSHALGRVWKDKSGKFTVEAELVDYQDGRVRLRGRSLAMLVTAARG